jgi:hypothetical protein
MKRRLFCWNEANGVTDCSRQIFPTSRARVIGPVDFTMRRPVARHDCSQVNSAN